MLRQYLIYLVNATAFYIYFRADSGLATIERNAFFEWPVSITQRTVQRTTYWIRKLVKVNFKV